MTDTTIEVTSEQFDQIECLLRESQTFREASRNPWLTPGQKLAFRKQADDTYNQARAIGTPAHYLP